MATYCIGDVHGCYQELQELLKLIRFVPEQDRLWFVGDLVNRGPDSLKVLRFVKSLPNKIVVLGNHDFHLLAVYHNIVNFESSALQQVITSPDAPELINWLRMQRLIHYDESLNIILVHAGIFPYWNLETSLKLAAEVEANLHAKTYIRLLKQTYGDEPNEWDDNLTSWGRLRFIINCLTRLRFCTLNGKLDFTYSGKVGSQPKGYYPWFRIPSRKIQKQRVVFGHWAALEGKISESNIFALDTGCVWGGSLTALRLEDGQKFSVPSKIKKSNE